MNVHIVNAAHDGLASMCTGVGRVAFNYATILSELVVRERLPVRLSVAHQPIEPWSILDDRYVRGRIDQAVCAAGGTRILLDDLPPCRYARECWQGVHHWRRCSESLSARIATFIRAGVDRRHVLIAHDSIFGMTRAAFDRAYPDLSSGLRVLWVVHSFNDVFPDVHSGAARREFETECVDSFHGSDGVVAVSRYMVDHLQSRVHDRVPVISIPNGWSPDHASISLQVHHLEGGAFPIILSGRATPQKGIVPFLHGLSIFLARPRAPACSLELFACAETDETDYLQAIRREAAKIAVQGCSVRIETAFRRDEPLRRFAALGGCMIFPSMFETSGMSVAEALAVRPPGASVAHSRLPCFDEVSGTDPGVIRFDPSSATQVADTLQAAFVRQNDRRPLTCPPGAVPFASAVETLLQEVLRA